MGNRTIINSNFQQIAVTDANLNVVGINVAVSNIKITGGAANQFLQTDGNGNLVFSVASSNGFGLPGGSNTQLQFNDNNSFGAVTTATFNKTTNTLAIVGNFTANTFVSNTITVSNIVANGNVTLGSNANVRITGGSNAQVLTTDGGGNLRWSSITASTGGSNTQFLFNDIGNSAGATTFTYDKTINTPKIQQFKEIANIQSVGISSSINYDILNQAILYYDGVSSANYTINFRGNSTSSLNSIMSIGDSFTITLVTNNGSSAYIPTGFQVDGITASIKWVNGVTPLATIATLQNSTVIYNFNLVKTSSAIKIVAAQTRFA